MKKSKKPRPMDKVCDMCGDIGVTKHLVTCCGCKRASKHIYCMENKLSEVPELWYCEECPPGAQSTPDGKVQDTHTKKNTERVLIAGSPSVKGVMEPSIRNTSFKTVESAKVKFISAEEVALLTSGGRVSDKQRRVGPASQESSQTPIKSPPILRRTSTCRSKLARPNAAKVLCQPTERSVGADVHFSSSVPTIAMEHVINDREGKIDKNKASGETFCTAVCKETPISGSVGAEQHLSSSKDIELAMVSRDLSIPVVHINDVQTKKGTDESSGEQSSTAFCKKMPIRESIGVNQHLSSSKDIMLRDCNLVMHTNDEKRNRATDESSGEILSTTLCKEMPKRGSGGVEQHFSSSEDIELAAVKSDNAPTMHINDGQRKRATDESSGFLHATDKKETMNIVRPAEQEDIDKTQGDNVRPLQAYNELRASHNEIALNVLTTGASGSVPRCDAQVENSGFQGRDLPLRLLISPEKKISNHPASETCWKGAFVVFDTVYNGIQAHFPAQVSHKAYDMSKKMPEELKFKMLPRANVWPKSFQLDAPTKYDIGFYFFPCDQERPKEKYIHLLKQIESDDLAMQSHISDVELLIFTSKQLAEDSQRVQSYLWGFFRHVKHSKSRQHMQKQFVSYSPVADMKSNKCNQLNIPLEGNSEEIDMEVDMIGGREIGRIDKPIPRRDTPLGFAKSLSEDTKYERESFIKFSFNKVANPIVQNVPPGFSKSPGSKHGATFPETGVIGGLASASTGGGYEKKASEACGLQSICHQVASHHNKSAKHDKSNYPTFSSETEKVFTSIDRPDYTKERYRLQVDTKLDSLSMNLSSEKQKWFSSVDGPNSTERDLPPAKAKLQSVSKNLPDSHSKDKWISMDMLKERKREIQKKLDVIDKRPSLVPVSYGSSSCSPEQLSTAAGQSRKYRMQGSNIKEDEINEKKKVTYQSELKSMNRHPFIVSGVYSSPLSNPGMLLLPETSPEELPLAAGQSRTYRMQGSNIEEDEINEKKMKYQNELKPMNKQVSSVYERL